MRQYEYLEKYYHCVYAVAEIYEYSSKFMDSTPYNDMNLKEAQALVWYSLHNILNIPLHYSVTILNTTYKTLSTYITFAESLNNKLFKRHISLMYKELENEHRALYRKYQHDKNR